MGALDHYKRMYDDAVKILAGDSNRSLLEMCVTHKSKTGEIVLFDSIDQEDSTDASEVAAASFDDYREDYDAISSPALADLTAILTPHQSVTKERTACSPIRAEAAYQFRDKDEVQQNATEHSEILVSKMRKMRKTVDVRILAALSAATQNRGKDGATSTAFPAGQKLGASGDITAFTKDTCGQILQLFEENWATDGDDDGQIWCVISPRTKRELVEQSGGTIQNQDFVTKRHLEAGTLPDIAGVRLISHPTVPNDVFYAWQKSAIVYNTFKPLRVRLGENSAFRYQWQIYMDKFHGTCRRDDNRVVQGTITRAT